MSLPSACCSRLRASMFLANCSWMVFSLGTAAAAPEAPGAVRRAGGRGQRAGGGGLADGGDRRRAWPARACRRTSSRRCPSTAQRTTSPVVPWGSRRRRAAQRPEAGPAAGSSRARMARPASQRPAREKRQGRRVGMRKPSGGRLTQGPRLVPTSRRDPPTAAKRFHATMITPGGVARQGRSAVRRPQRPHAGCFPLLHLNDPGIYAARSRLKATVMCSLHMPISHLLNSRFSRNPRVLAPSETRLWRCTPHGVWLRRWGFAVPLKRPRLGARASLLPWTPSRD